MAGAFVVGKSYPCFNFWSGKNQHWELIARAKVMGTFKCVETGETYRVKIRKGDRYGDHVIDYEAAYFPRERGVNTVTEKDLS